MTAITEKTILDFYTYPSIGDDDWRYVFETATVRTLEMQMLSKATLVDMANAPDFKTALDLLSSGEYAVQGERSFVEIENTLMSRRTAVQELFAVFIKDEALTELFRSRFDFSNLRLALRRKLTDKPVGEDYSNDGNVGVLRLKNAFENDNYGEFPVYMQQAAEQAILAYYENKDIRQIDYAIDSAQAEFNLQKAKSLNNIFLTGLFKIAIDLTNIRTIFRVKFNESELRNVFLDGGYIEPGRLRQGLDTGYESMGALFFVTPYHRIVESGAGYLETNKSFLKLEQQCDKYLTGFLKLTVQITAGVQPIIAYFLMKENEIRMVRFILTGKKNYLEPRLILDRLGA